MSASAPCRRLASGRGRRSGSSSKGRWPYSCSSSRRWAVGDKSTVCSPSCEERLVVMGGVLARFGRATHAAFVAITPPGAARGLHPQAQPKGRSKAEDGAARLVPFVGEITRVYRDPRKDCARSRRVGKSRAAVAGPRRFRPDRPLEGRRAAPIPAGPHPDRLRRRNGRTAPTEAPQLNVEESARHPPARAGCATNTPLHRARTGADRR